MENPGTNTTIGRNHQRKGEFRKVGENLYRYSTSGTYYAVFRVQGKLIWKSLETDDRELANRKQFLDIVKHLRGYNLSYEVGGKTFVMELEHDDSADLIEFMGKAGVGTAECANLCGQHIDFKATDMAEC